MAPPTFAIAALAYRAVDVERRSTDGASLPGWRPARKPSRGAGALQPDLAVDAPERRRCLTRAVGSPGSERQQEERSAHGRRGHSSLPNLSDAVTQHALG